MALDPRQVVNDVADRARRVELSEPPLLLRRSAEAPPPLDAIHGSEEMAIVHRRWANIHSAAGSSVGEGAGTAGVRAKVRARVTTAAVGAARSVQQEDRALLGDVIRAIDALARQLDEVAARVSRLEGLTEEVVNVLSDDVVRIRALLAGSVGTRERGEGR